RARPFVRMLDPVPKATRSMTGSYSKILRCNGIGKDYDVPGRTRCMPAMRATEVVGFSGSLISAPATSLDARAQQLTLPLVGFLSSRSLSESAYALAAFHEGLKQGGYVEG